MWPVSSTKKHEQQYRDNPVLTTVQITFPDKTKRILDFIYVAYYKKRKLQNNKKKIEEKNDTIST